MKSRALMFFMLWMCLYCGLLKASENRSQPTVFSVAKLGQTIYDGVFTGNGLLGTMTYLKGNNAIRIDLGRTDIYDHRESDDYLLYKKARLPLGHIQLLLHQDQIISAKGEMHLVQADAKAIVYTEKGVLSIKTTTLSHTNFIIIEIDDSKYTGHYDVGWQPELPLSPRFQFTGISKPMSIIDLPSNPAGTVTESQGVVVYNQLLYAGGGYAVGYKVTAEKYGKQLIAAIDYSQTSTKYVEQVSSDLRNFTSDLTSHYHKHRVCWQDYFAKSNFSIPDQELQDFYQMQLYKLACATRADKPAMDLQGPWTSKTPWPAYWHNLNIQLAYSPVYTANHLEISQSLLNMIDCNVTNLCRNVPLEYQHDAAAIGRSSSSDMISPVLLTLRDRSDKKEVMDAELGNLTWMLFYYYQHYRYSLNPEVGERLFNLLKRSVNYYLHLLEKTDGGAYQIAVKTYSPEYPNGYAFNTNYDLAILRWGLKTLLSLNLELGQTDSLALKWRAVSDSLIPYAQSENGFKIAQDVPYATSHRHYSHLMMIYPFYEFNWDQSENRELIDRSIKHWQSMPESLQGYSLTGLASMKAMMGDGGGARDALKKLLQHFVKANTLYAESGPVIETPLAAMASLQEMCLQFWDGQVRVFPAVPEDWKEISFKDFRTDGAFLISGTRVDGKNTIVTIESEKGGRICIRPNLLGKITWKSDGKVRFIQMRDQLYEFEMAAGSKLFLRAN